MTKTKHGGWTAAWQQDVEAEVRQALENDLLTGATVEWTAPKDGIGPPDLEVRAAYRRPPQNANVYKMLRDISDQYHLTVLWECFQDEDRCEDDYPYYWDDRVRFSP